MTTTDRRRTFDEVADQYERFRPGYPEALVDDVAWLADLPAGGRILEIGSGTGKATVAFAARGYRMTCIELGPHLAAIARRKLLPYPQVEVEVTAFEDWPAPAAAFDLVMAAQCFHFLDAGPALHAIAATLRPGGALAIFGNSERRCDPQIDRAVNEAYRRFGPTRRSAVGRWPWSTSRACTWRAGDPDARLRRG
jgi:SAM-dependent methyltransferase